jgi:hypothetical protein
MTQRYKHNKLIARKGDDYYFLDEFFEYNDGFKGATGTIMHPITEEAYDHVVENWDFTELWKSEVIHNMETCSLEEFANRDWDDENYFDLSYCNTYGDELMDLLEDHEDYQGDQKIVLVECVGGGRCFDVDDEFDEIFDEVMLFEIMEWEEKECKKT